MPKWLSTRRLRLDIEGFLESRRQNGCAAATVDGYHRKKLKRFYAFVEKGGFRQVTPDVIRGFFDTIAHLKPNTRGSHLRSLKTFFNWLVWERVLSISPVAEARIRIPCRQKVKILPSTQEVNEALVQLRRQCYGTKDIVFDRLRDLAIILFVLETGVRRTELARMITSETNLGLGRAIVRAKGPEDRTVYFPHSREALRFYHDERERRFGADGQQQAFWVNKWGRPLTPDGVSQVFDRIRRRTGLQITPHLVRAISATWAAAQILQQGGDGRSAGLMLEAQYGWKDPRTPRIYINLASDEALRSSLHQQFSPINRLRPPLRTRRQYKDHRR